MSSDEAATSDAETAEVTDVAEAPAPSGNRTLVLGAALFALAGLIAAAVFGVMWWAAAGDDNATLANSRDAVAKAGVSAIKAYTEVDFEHLDDFFNRQKSVSDDKMGQQLSQLEPTYRKALTDAKTKVTTNVFDVAVEELDDHEGKASFLAAISTHVTQGDKSSDKPLRLEVSMTRVGEEWKLSGIDNVPLVAAGQ